MVGTVTSQEEKLHPSPTTGPFSLEFAIIASMLLKTLISFPRDNIYKENRID